MTFNRQGLAQAVNSGYECAMERIGNLIDSVGDRNYLDEENSDSIIHIKGMIDEGMMKDINCF